MLWTKLRLVLAGNFLFALFVPCDAIAELVKCPVGNGNYAFKEKQSANPNCQPLKLVSNKASSQDGGSYHLDSNGCKIHSFLYGAKRPDSLTWSGACKAGYASGYGTVTAQLSDGLRVLVKATYVHGNENGAVLAETSNSAGSTLLSLEARDGKFLPKGLVQYAGGETYEGEINTSTFKPNGYGRYHRIYGVYEGTFLNGLEHGPAQVTLKNGDRLFAIFTNGKPPAYGRWLRSNGDIYEGELDKLDANGKGVLWFSGGKRTFRGSFKDGIPDGEGIMDDVENGSFVVVADGPRMNIKNLDKYAEVLAKNRLDSFETVGKTTEAECIQKGFTLHSGDLGRSLAAAGACKSDPSVNDNVAFLKASTGNFQSGPQSSQGYIRRMPDGSLVDADGTYYKRMPDGSYANAQGEYIKRMPDGSYVTPNGVYSKRMPDGSFSNSDGSYSKRMPDGSYAGSNGRYYKRMPDGSYAISR